MAGAFGTKGFARRSSVGEAASDANLVGDELRAAVAINRGDLVQIGPRGLATPVGNTNYASGRISMTGLGGGFGDLLSKVQFAAVRTAGGRHPVLLGKDGSIYFVAATTGVGLTVYRYACDGQTLIGTAALNSAATIATAIRMVMMADGNIALAWTAGAQIYTSVIDLKLDTVAAVTAGAALLNATTVSFDMIALAGGGFAVGYLTAGAVWTIQTFSAVAASTGALAVLALIGGANTATLKLAQLANGNIVGSCASSFTTTAGLYFAICTPLAVSVVAATNLSATVAGTTAAAEIGVMPGYIHIAYQATATVYVRTTAGAAQATYAITGCVATGDATAKFFTDGLTAYFLVIGSVTTMFLLFRTTLAGANPKSQTFTNGGATCVTFDGAYNPSDNFLVIAMQTTQANVGRPITIDLTNLVLEGGGNFNVNVTTIGSYVGMALLPDYCFVYVFDAAETASTNFAMWKWGRSAIIGPAMSAAAPGGSFMCESSPGAYSINAIPGLPSVNFDMSAINANVQSGNKGVVSNNGVVLKGI